LLQCLALKKPGIGPVRGSRSEWILSLFALSLTN
jgi:hypothetical protein